MATHTPTTRWSTLGGTNPRKGKFLMKQLVRLLILMLLAPMALAQEAAEDEEVIVIAELSRAEVRQYIEEVEAQVYEIFNANNDDDAFDIFCRNETPTGSNIQQRVCEPQFMTDARAKNVNDFRLGGDELLTPRGLNAELEAEFQQLTEKMEALTTENPSFREIVGILNALRARQEQLQN